MKILYFIDFTSFFLSHSVILTSSLFHSSSLLTPHCLSHIFFSCSKLAPKLGFGFSHSKLALKLGFGFWIWDRRGSTEIRDRGGMGLDRWAGISWWWDWLTNGFESVDLLISGWIGKHKHHSAIANKNPSLKTQTQISKDTDKKERALNKKNKENKEIKSERERERERT